MRQFVFLLGLVNNDYLRPILSFPRKRESRFFRGLIGLDSGFRLKRPSRQALGGNDRGENLLFSKLFLLLALAFIPALSLANGGDQRVVENKYLINLSRAPFTPRVGVKTSFLASFVDIQKDALIADDLIVDIRIAKLGGSGIGKRDFMFSKDGIAVKGGILELPYTFAESGLHEIFFDFAFASNLQDVHEAPDFLIDVQSPSLAQMQNRNVIFLIVGGTLCGFVIGWFMRRRYA